jgi:hypothetical protein
MAFVHSSETSHFVSSWCRKIAHGDLDDGMSERDETEGVDRPGALERIKAFARWALFSTL